MAVFNLLFYIQNNTNQRFPNVLFILFHLVKKKKVTHGGEIKWILKAVKKKIASPALNLITTSVRTSDMDPAEFLRLPWINAA